MYKKEEKYKIEKINEYCSEKKLNERIFLDSILSVACLFLATFHAIGCVFGNKKIIEGLIASLYTILSVIQIRILLYNIKKKIQYEKKYNYKRINRIDDLEKVRGR